MSLLYPIDHEKQFLSAVIRSEGAILAECPQINEFDFGPDTYRPVFRAIKQCISNTGMVSRFTLIAALESLNIKIGGALEPSLAINSLVDLNMVNDRAAVDIAAQIKRWTVRRELYNMGREIVERTKGDDGTPSVKLIGEVMGTFNNKVNLLGGADDEPTDLYANLEKFLETDNSIYLSKCLKPPYPIYTDMYGDFDPGNTYVVVSRMKVGKSTFGLSTIQQMATQMAKDGIPFRALILDTEMSEERAMARIISSETGIREYYILKQTYKRRPEMAQKVSDAIKRLKPLFNQANVDHVYVGGMDLEEQLSVTRRWAFKHLRNGTRGIVMMDYLKLNSAADWKSGKNISTAIGEKMDAYKNLGIELNVPTLIFCQANRDNEDSKAAGKMQNTSVVAGSDDVARFATNVYLLEKLTLEQKVWLNLLDPNQATHSLTVLAPRQLGPNETGMDCTVKFKDKLGKDKYIDNFLLFSFHNFKVSEFGTFKEAVERVNILQNVQHPQPPPAGQNLL
jgi:replicative DNA helicase